MATRRERSIVIEILVCFTRKQRKPSCFVINTRQRSCLQNTTLLIVFKRNFLTLPPLAINNYRPPSIAVKKRRVGGWEVTRSRPGRIMSVKDRGGGGGARVVKFECRIDNNPVTYHHSNSLEIVQTLGCLRQSSADQLEKPRGQKEA